MERKPSVFEPKLLNNIIYLKHRIMCNSLRRERGDMGHFALAIYKHVFNEIFE